MSDRGYVIKLVGQVGGVIRNEGAKVGTYVRSFDPSAHDGRGDLEVTDDIDQALVYPSINEAMMAWRAVPANRPRRPDGKPNRPMTAFSVELVPV